MLRSFWKRLHLALTFIFRKATVLSTFFAKISTWNKSYYKNNYSLQSSQINSTWCLLQISFLHLLHFVFSLLFNLCLSYVYVSVPTSSWTHLKHDRFGQVYHCQDAPLPLWFPTRASSCWGPWFANHWNAARTFSWLQAWLGPFLVDKWTQNLRVWPHCLEEWFWGLCGMCREQIQKRLSAISLTSCGLSVLITKGPHQGHL